MNRITEFFIVAAFWIAIVLLYINTVQAAPAFPGAVGFGADTQGGRGGNIYYVTNTNSSGAGSFANALSSAGPRIIFFKTGGVINGMEDIPANTTIFAQTAPGDGVAIRNSVRVSVGSNVIIRGLRFFAYNGNADLLRLRPSTDVVIDHSSFAWWGNSGITSWGNWKTSDVRRVTLSYNALYEGLYGNCGDRDEGHPMQLAPINEATVYRNLIVNAPTRSPLFAGPSWRVEVINNLVHSGAMRLDPTNSNLPNDTDTTLAHAISNIYKNANTIRVIGGQFTNDSRVYVQDNVQPDSNAITQSNNPVFTSPVSSSDIVSRGQAENEFLADIGPIPRSSYLDRAVDDYLDDRDRALCVNDLPNISFSAGNYEGQYGPDNDGDGMPNSFETENGLNPNNASDAEDFSTNGYMWIEEYANSLFGATPGDPDPPPAAPSAPSWIRIES